MDKKEPYSRLPLRFYVAALMLFAPLALLAALLSPNDYIAQGIEGGVDCDGPLGVMIFAIPSYLLYGISAAGFGIQAVRKASWSYGIIALLCVLVVALVTQNVIGAYHEHFRPLHKETCGEGW